MAPFLLMKHSMKFNKTNKILIAGLLLIGLMTSCAKDDENQPSTPGSDRDKFVGTWLCSESISNGPTTVFTLNITKQGSADTIYIYNFNNLGSPFYAIGLVSGNSLVIPSQDITQVSILGTGIFTQDKIQMNYTADSDTLSATCSK